MALTSSPYTASYNSFSGVDVKAVFGSIVIGEIQAISYSVTREKAPIYTMGSADPRSFSRGKRGIAGTLVFVMFDRHAILGTLGGLAPGGGLKFQSDIDDIRAEFRDPDSGGFESSLASTSKVSASNPVQYSESPISNVAGDQELAGAWYVDQIPPFDITLAAANEYGALAIMKVVGAELLNEGYGISVDDVVSEFQYSYVARQIVPWTSVPSKNVYSIASQGGVSIGG